MQITMTLANAQQVDGYIRKSMALESRAMLRAATQSMYHVVKRERAVIRDTVDRPTSFTKAAVGYERPGMKGGAGLLARVYIKDVQANYLRWVIEGGRATTLKPVPFRWVKNTYGNMPLGKTNGASSFTGSKGRLYIVKGRKGGGVATRHDVFGFWSRNRVYRSRFSFYNEANDAMKSFRFDPTRYR